MILRAYKKESPAQELPGNIFNFVISNTKVLIQNLGWQSKNVYIYPVPGTSFGLVKLISTDLKIFTQKKETKCQNEITY